MHAPRHTRTCAHTISHIPTRTISHKLTRTHAHVFTHAPTRTHTQTHTCTRAHPERWGAAPRPPTYELDLRQCLDQARLHMPTRKLAHQLHCALIHHLHRNLVVPQGPQEVPAQAGGSQWAYAKVSGCTHAETAAGSACAGGRVTVGRPRSAGTRTPILPQEVPAQRGRCGHAQGWGARMPNKQRERALASEWGRVHQGRAHTRGLGCKH